jgi:apolipoprotein N-acyltransferase
VVFVLYAALQWIQLALFALLVRRLGFGPLLIFPALFWVPLEFLFPLLFPWYIANSQVAFLWVIQTADLVGPYGTGFIVMWFSAALYHALFTSAEPRKKILPLAYASLAIVVALVYGFQRLQSVGDEMAGARKLSVGVVQGNVDIDMKWNPVLAQKNLDQHRQLTNDLPAVPLVVWPESAIEAIILERVQALPLDVMPAFKSDRTYFIFGAKSFRGNPGRTDGKAFNTAFFTDSKGRILARYHKQVLLAFGEYLPFAKLLSWIPALPMADGFTPGPGPVVFHLPRAVRVAPLICYDAVVPGLAIEAVRAGAELMVTLSNDAWFATGEGPHLHLVVSAFRSLETRTSQVRATNTGISAIISPTGELLAEAGVHERRAIAASVPAAARSRTLMLAWGDWFCPAALVLGVLLLGVTRWTSAR